MRPETSILSLPGLNLYILPFSRQGNTRVALYGLGSIRDERLSRLFAQAGMVTWWDLWPELSLNLTDQVTVHPAVTIMCSNFKCAQDLNITYAPLTHRCRPQSTETCDTNDWVNLMVLHQASP